MPGKVRRQVKAIRNVSASKTATIDLPGDFRIHRVVLAHGYAAGTNTIAAAATNITEIRLFKDGRVQWKLSGTQLRDRNLLYGIPGTVSYDFTGLPNTAPGVTMVLHFAEPWMQDEKDQDALALPKGNYYLEVDIGAASTPTLAASFVGDRSDAASNFINKIIQLSMPAGSTSFDYFAQNNLRGGFLRVLTVYPDSGASNALTELDVNIDNDLKHDLLTLTNTAQLLNSQMAPAASGRTANVYDAVFDHDGLLDSAIDCRNVRTVQITVKAGGAMSGTTTALAEVFGPPD